MTLFAPPDKVQASFPGATVTVFNAGTVTLATIFADDNGTPKANPFTADTTDGMWFFYAAQGAYDVQFSGGGVPVPFTIGALGDTTKISTLLSPAYVNAADFAGGDVGARINAAQAALPSTGGTIDVRPLYGAQTWTTAVVITKPITLWFGSCDITFSGSGALTLQSVGCQLIGQNNGGTTFRPAASYTGTFVTVNVGTVTNGFGYGYGVRLQDFKIVDGTGDFNGTGRTAFCDGVVIANTDNVELVNVQVRNIKGFSLRLRNVRESVFHSFYSLLGGDESHNKPAVMIGNLPSDGLTDDCNDSTFTSMRIGYPYARGLVIDTQNPTSISGLAVARGLNFYELEIEGDAVSPTGVFGPPQPYDLVQLGRCNTIRFFGGLIGNWLINNTTVCGLRVGSDPTFFIPDTVETYGTDFFGPSSQTYQPGFTNYGTGIIVDRVNTFQMHGGRIITTDTHLATINITPHAGRIYIDPLTRIEQLADPQNSNGAGITGTLTGLTGMYPPVGSPTGQEVVGYASAAIQVGNWVGNPNNGTVNLKVASNGGASILSTDSAGTGYFALRAKAGLGGGTVAVDSDDMSVGPGNFIAFHLTGDTRLRRFLASTGYATVVADYTLAGWGASAVVTVGSQSNNTRGTVTVTTNAADVPSAGPSITLTFHNTGPVADPYAQSPFAVANMNDSSTGPPQPVTTVTSTTQLLMRYQGTPTAHGALTYTFNYIIVG